jgi:hypothetical protein
MKPTVFLLGALICGCASGAIGYPGWDTPDAHDNCKDHNLWSQTTSPWLLTAPKVHLVFWGNWWFTSGGHQLDQMAQTWNILANDPNFYQPLSEYGIGSGSLNGIFFSNWNLPSGKISDDYIQQELQSEIIAGDLPSLDSNSIYVFLLPPNTQAAYDIQNHFAGYHGHIGSKTTYSAIEYQTNHGMDSIISHEIYEAATDPDGTGFHGGPGETEVGDYCGTKYILDGYSIQQVWSQTQCQCIPSANAWSAPNGDL